MRGVVGMPDHEVDIAKNMRTIDWLKVELLSGISSLFKFMLKGSEELIIDALASIIITCYILGKRLGIGFARVDLKAMHKLRVNISDNHQVEQWYGDLSALLEYMEKNLAK